MTQQPEKPFQPTKLTLLDQIRVFLAGKGVYPAGKRVFTVGGRTCRARVFSGWREGFSLLGKGYFGWGRVYLAGRGFFWAARGVFPAGIALEVWLREKGLFWVFPLEGDGGFFLAGRVSSAISGTTPEILKGFFLLVKVFFGG